MTQDTNTGKRKVPFKTNVKQSDITNRELKIQNARRVAEYEAPKRNPIRATRYEADLEKKRQIRWLLKWALLLPLCAYAVSWLLLILVDLFKG